MVAIHSARHRRMRSSFRSSMQKAETACHLSPLRLALKNSSCFCSAGKSEETHEYASRCLFMMPFSKISTARRRGSKTCQVLVPWSIPLSALSDMCLRPATRKLFGNWRKSRRLWSPSASLPRGCGGGGALALTISFLKQNHKQRQREERH